MVVLPADPVPAWEISVEGEFEHRYQYLARTGSNDLFGMVDLQESQAFPLGRQFQTTNFPKADNFIGCAGPSCYGTGWTATIPAKTATAAGWRVTRGGYSRTGSDFTIDQSRLTMKTTIRPSRAIKAYFVYNLGGNRNRFTEYDNPALVHAIRIPVSAAPVKGPPIGYWQVTDARVKDGVGTPPFSRYYTHENRGGPAEEHGDPNVTTAIGCIEGFEGAVDLPWGKVSLGAKSFPWGTGATFGPNTRLETFSLQRPGGPLLLTWQFWPGHGFGQTVPSIPANPLPVEPVKPQLLQFWDIRYRNGFLDLGIATYWQRSHFNREDLESGGFPEQVRALDQNIIFNTLYARYFTGRFLFATEYSWFMADNYFHGVAPLYQEGYHWFLEIAFVTGPARLSLMYALASGPVLNNGNPTKSYEPFPINCQALESYQWLMFKVFGGGNQAFGGFFMPSDGNGMLADGEAFGVRLDYAIASNLNLWASYMRARRLECAGNYIGAIIETDSETRPGTLLNPGPDIPNPGPPFFGDANGYPWRSPYADNDEIGWEINVGLHWQLLEGYFLKLHYAFWQPGHWFDWAYQAITLRGREPRVTRDGVLTTRDPIQSFEWSLVSEF